MKQVDNEPWMEFVCLLRTHLAKQGVSQADLANKTGLKQSNISRLLCLKYCPTLKTYLTICLALDINIELTHEDSPGDTERIR